MIPLLQIYMPEAKALYDVNHIVVEEQLSGQRQKTNIMDDFVVETACGAHRGISTDAEHLKTKLLYLCLDRMVIELKNRFSAINCSIVFKHVVQYLKTSCLSHI